MDAGEPFLRWNVPFHETTPGNHVWRGLSKNLDEGMDFLNYVAEKSKGWDEPNPREVERMKPTVNQRGGIYSLIEDVELKAKLSTLNRRMEEL